MKRRKNINKREIGLINVEFLFLKEGNLEKFCVNPYSKNG